MKTSRPNLIKFRGAVYRLADIPTPKQQDVLLRPERGENLTRSQQITLLKSGVEAWNRWYRSQAEGADLYRADLPGADLQGADLSGATLEEANLKGTNLAWANLKEAYLQRADLPGANLRGAYLYRANLYGADLRGADLRGADLRRANLPWANLYGAHYNDNTEFPQGLDPEAARMVLK